MNYPFRTALLAYLRGGDADDFREAMETLRENYPPAAFYSAMNFLGTHDTPRVLTLLGTDHTRRARRTGRTTACSPGAEQGCGKAAAGVSGAVHLSRLPDDLLRRRGRDGGL